VQLNHDELVKGLTEIPNVHVQSVSMEGLSFRDQLLLMKNTSVLVGMHGSGLTNVIFLPAGASSVELFPYKFQRTSYQDLSKMAGVSYTFWQNPDKEKARFHPDVLDHHQLPEAEKDKIKANPIFTSSWAANLYWVNQDTTVDVTAIKNHILAQALTSPFHQKITARQPKAKAAAATAAASGGAPGKDNDRKVDEL